MQFETMPPGPKLICGDLNAQRGCLSTLEAMLAEEGWTDIGNDDKATRGNTDQHTCHANAGVKESRIDFIITNEHLTPAVLGFEIIDEADFPTHRPIRMKVASAKLKSVTNQLRRPTNFATLFQEKVDNEIKAKQDAMDAEAREKNEEPKKADENAIRKSNLDRLHGLMDKHIKSREFRLKKAVCLRDTTTQWDLIAAAAEEANIEFHGLSGKDAAKMKGRSKITFQKKEIDILQDTTNQRDNDDLQNQVKWLKKMAGQHAKLGNKLLATARRIKAAGFQKEKDQAKTTNEKLISTTIHSYIMLAGDQARKHILTDDQKKQICSTWSRGKQGEQQGGRGEGNEEGQGDKHIKDIQKAAQEFKEMLIHVLECDVTNTTHSAKLQRIGESHAMKAKEFQGKLKAELVKARRQENDCPQKRCKKHFQSHRRSKG